jgi:hypothetical protein
MPRQNDGTEIWRKHVSTDLYTLQTGTIGDTTTTAAVLGDGSEATVSVTAITNFSASDPAFIIGDGGVELVKIGTPATNMPVTFKPKIPQSAGARFVEARKIPLGKTSDAGISLSPSKQLTEIFSSVDDLPVAYVDGPLSLDCSIPLLGYNTLNLALMGGFSQDTETGTGTTADPWSYGIHGASALMSTAVVCFRGFRHDAKYVLVDLLDCRFQANGSIDHNRNSPAVIPVSLKARGMVVRIATAAFDH